MKSKLREILNRNKGISNEARRRNYKLLYNDKQIYIELVNLFGDCVKKRYYPFCKVVAVATVEWIIALYVFWRYCYEF